MGTANSKPKSPRDVRKAERELDQNDNSMWEISIEPYWEIRPELVQLQHCTFKNYSRDIV
jgi:hypothetical protein